MPINEKTTRAVKPCGSLVEHRRFELLTFSMPLRASVNIFMKSQERLG
jgi:hypothetical protein